MLSYNVLNSWVEKMMKKSLPVKIKTSNITTLSTKDINKLKAGDIVLKKTGNQKHAYIVSYKEENQGICLTYADASVIETVSYDYNTTTKTWVYNSTDITQVQPKLTAGSNIQINGNTISATDTTYTAGSNITITDGVISAAAVQSYTHYIRISGTHLAWKMDIIFEIINSDNTPFTKTTLSQYLYEHYRNGNNYIYIIANGYYVSTAQGYERNGSIEGVTSYSAPSDGTVNVLEFDHTIGTEDIHSVSYSHSDYTFTDTVI